QQQQQQQQYVEYPISLTTTMVQTEDIIPLNHSHLGMNLVRADLGMMDYDAMAMAENQHPHQTNGSMVMAQGFRTGRSLSACSYTSFTSPCFSSPSTASPSPILHAAIPASASSPFSISDRKRHSYIPSSNTKRFSAVSSSSIPSISSTALVAIPRLSSSSLSKPRPKSFHGTTSSNIDNRPRTKSESKSNKDRFVCHIPGCGRTFSRPFNLKSHGMTHETLRPYACNQCDKTFARIHDRDRHLKGHLVEKAHFCVVCLGRFARQDAVTRHLKLAKEKNPCAVILKEHEVSFRDAAAGRITREFLGDESTLRRRYEELEEEVRKIKATKSLEKGMRSLNIMALNHSNNNNKSNQSNHPLQIHPLSSASQSPLITCSYEGGDDGEYGSPSPEHYL
ncbi:hypothetical protein BGX29_002884, partial [Mortierella sp. GBA35]